MSKNNDTVVMKITRYYVKECSIRMACVLLFLISLDIFVSIYFFFKLKKLNFSNSFSAARSIVLIFKFGHSFDQLYKYIFLNNI